MKQPLDSLKGPFRLIKIVEWLSPFEDMSILRLKIMKNQTSSTGEDVQLTEEIINRIGDWEIST